MRVYCDNKSIINVVLNDFNCLNIKRFVNFLLNIFVICANSKLQIRSCVSKIHLQTVTAKYTEKHVAQVLTVL